MALYSLFCAEVPLRNCSLAHSLTVWKLLTFCEWLHMPSGVRMRLLYFIGIGRWSVPNWITARSFMAQRESHTSVCWIRSRSRHSASAWVHFEHRQPQACMWKQTRSPWNFEEDCWHHNTRSRHAQIWVTQLETALLTSGSPNSLTNVRTKSARSVSASKRIYPQLVSNRKTFSPHLSLLFHHGLAKTTIHRFISKQLR